MKNSHLDVVYPPSPAPSPQIFSSTFLVQQQPREPRSLSVRSAWAAWPCCLQGPGLQTLPGWWRWWWWSSDPMWLWSRWRLHRRRGGFGTFMSCVEINLFKLKSAPVFTPTNWDLISKTLVRLFYTKKPAGRGCNRWREVGWKANLGDAYVLRVPLGLPWVGRIWQKRSVQQKNPPLCLSMGY